MKVLNDLIAKVGNDKVLHFVCGWLISLVINVVIILEQLPLSNGEILGYALIGPAICIFLEFMKECILDKEFDKKDIIATAIGIACAYLTIIIGVIL